jgi:hypothetical protein
MPYAILLSSPDGLLPTFITTTGWLFSPFFVQRFFDPFRNTGSRTATLTVYCSLSSNRFRALRALSHPTLSEVRSRSTILGRPSSARSRDEPSSCSSVRGC